VSIECIDFFKEIQRLLSILHADLFFITMITAHAGIHA
jgi:hypothetical protein